MDPQAIPPVRSAKQPPPGGGRFRLRNPPLPVWPTPAGIRGGGGDAQEPPAFRWAKAIGGASGGEGFPPGSQPTGLGGLLQVSPAWRGGAVRGLRVQGDP